jgi:hypothetical protein
MATYSSAGNPLISETAVIKSGPNAGGTTTVHRRANLGSAGVEVALGLAGDLQDYIREQEAALQAARAGYAREEAARFAGLVTGRWADAETAYFKLDENRYDEDGEQVMTVTLRDRHGDKIEDLWLDQTPESTLARFDQSALRGLHRMELNIADLTAEKNGGVPNFSGKIFRAEVEIASANLAEYCGDILKNWAEAETVTFTFTDGRDGPMLLVEVADDEGYEVNSGTEAQDRFDRIEYHAVKRFGYETIDMKAAAAWQPGDEPLG